MLTLYSALVIFILGVFGLVIWIAKVPLKPFCARGAGAIHAGVRHRQQ